MIKKSGFTLVEMLISMGIMSILLVILTQVFGSILNMKLRSQATTSVAEDSRYLFSRLTYDIARASDLSVPNSSTLILTVAGSTYTYSLIDTTLMLSVDGGQSQSLNSVGTKINSLNFTRYTDQGNKKLVQIRFVIASTTIQAGGSTGERQLTTTVATR